MADSESQEQDTGQDMGTPPEPDGADQAGSQELPAEGADGKEDD